MIGCGHQREIRSYNSWIACVATETLHSVLTTGYVRAVDACQAELVSIRPQCYNDGWEIKNCAIKGEEGL